MSNPKIRLGVMGCANIAERMVIPAILQSPFYELVLVASRDQEKGKRYAEKFGCRYVTGYDELIASPDIDMVYMPLPTGLHLEWALKTLDAGKHILLEKSLATNADEARQIVDKAKQKNRLIQENFMFAFHRQFGLIRDLLRQKRVGEVRCVRSSFGFPPFPDPGNIRYSKALGGGALLDAGAYTLKIAQLLLGEGVEVLSSILHYDPAKDVDLYGGIFLADKQGVAIETAFGFDQFYQCNLEIWGNKGKITADRIFTAGPGIKPVVKIEEAGNAEIIEVEADNHFLNLLNDFASTVYSGNYGSKYNEIENQALLVQATREKARNFILP